MDRDDWIDLARFISAITGIGRNLVALRPRRR